MFHQLTVSFFLPHRCFAFLIHSYYHLLGQVESVTKWTVQLTNCKTTAFGSAQPCTNTNQPEQTSFHPLPTHWAKVNQFILESIVCFPNLLKFESSARESEKSWKDVCKTSMLHSFHDFWNTSFYSPNNYWWHFCETIQIKNYKFSPLANV